MYQPCAIAIHVENATSCAPEDVEALIDRNWDRFALRHADWLSGYPDGPPRLWDLRTSDPTVACIGSVGRIHCETPHEGRSGT